ncbi:hypothetical protein PGTUg99_006788 [Puccinia graminis f. sp. tritici]|uniref:Uncharacterized protein n=1 Tax=Puccinia graminis f. sp. tritici TaxID=56615 RepID=A0A5B0SH60_PUCGR|nr:hypothetical protein PGTUg99_006788 [Puccinia graminis f. sp. tritici]
MSECRAPDPYKPFEPGTSARTLFDCLFLVWPLMRVLLDSLRAAEISPRDTSAALNLIVRLPRNALRGHRLS